MDYIPAKTILQKVKFDGNLWFALTIILTYIRVAIMAVSIVIVGVPDILLTILIACGSRKTV
ncbi:MAG: hypothetical protein WBP35_06495 [Lactococcus chungangensis]